MVLAWKDVGMILESNSGLQVTDCQIVSHYLMPIF